ncbi:hypothetical protein CHU98_g3419 [Xylaria longipes]|nr:hypothetical protein CHU98_g3419 [Xylaria longipes]
MNVIAGQAIQLFNSSSICQETPNLHSLLHVVAICAHENNYHEFDNHQIESTEAEVWLEETRANSSVQLITIPIDESDGRLPISASVFKRLITKLLKVDPCVLWFIASRYDGFHRIDNATSTSYVMATSMYMLVWRFGRQRGSTAGLLFDRHQTFFSEVVPDLLASFYSHARSPGLLPMISAVTEDILDNSKSRLSLSPTRESSSGRDIDSAVRLLKSRVTAFEGYVVYLKERADRLSSVIFALLTHEDAAVSADMAKSSQALAGQSTYIAEQAKRDSSAMKTITVITMAFLPATFFATLFALPTLDWKGETIVTSEFWIYWAFTLPTTALVFFLWLFLMNKTWILTSFLGLFNGK